MPNIRKFLDLSTAHLRPETREKLDEALTPSELPFVGGATVYGWFVFAPEDEEEDLAPELWRCMQYAREHGCEYLLFDADAEVIDDLPAWDDDGSE